MRCPVLISGFFVLASTLSKQALFLAAYL